MIPHYENGQPVTRAYWIDGATISIYKGSGNSDVYEYDHTTGLVGRYVTTTWRS